MMYEFRSVKGHIEVYQNGRFCFSADTTSEAQAELENYTESQEDV